MRRSPGFAGRVRSTALAAAGTFAVLLAPAGAVGQDRPAIHISLDLDVSGSARRNGGFEETQRGAIAFLEPFYGARDRIGLVSFMTVAGERIAARRSFKRRVAREIGALEILSDTNVEDGLRRGKQQLDATPDGSGVRKAIVLFNDGPSTAFTGRFEFPTGLSRRWYRGVVAAYTAGSSYRGLFRLQDGAKVRTFDPGGRPITLPNTSTQTSIQPRKLPGNRSVTGTNIRAIAAEQVKARAAKIRAHGYAIYVVGFANVGGMSAGDIVDPALLRHIANEDAVADPKQPIGRAIIVTSPEEIESAFVRLARLILQDIR